MADKIKLSEDGLEYVNGGHDQKRYENSGSSLDDCTFTCIEGEHDWKYVGTDGNMGIYECTKCHRLWRVIT